MSTKKQFQDLSREMAVAASEWKQMRQVPPPQFFGDQLQKHSASLRSLLDGETPNKGQYQDIASEMSATSTEWKLMKQVPPPSYFGGRLHEFSVKLRKLSDETDAPAGLAPIAEVLAASKRGDDVDLLNTGVTELEVRVGALESRFDNLVTTMAERVASLKERAEKAEAEIAALKSAKS